MNSRPGSTWRSFGHRKGLQQGHRRALPQSQGLSLFVAAGDVNDREHSVRFSVLHGRVAKRAGRLGGPRLAPPRQTLAVVCAVGRGGRSARWPVSWASPWSAAQSPLLPSLAFLWLRAPSSSLGGCNKGPQASYLAVSRYSNSLINLQHVEAKKMDRRCRPGMHYLFFFGNKEFLANL